MLIKKLTKHGNSLALVIDKPILDMLNIGHDTQVALTISNNGLTVTPVDEALHQKRFQEASDLVLEQHSSLFKRLAE